MSERRGAARQRFVRRVALVLLASFVLGLGGGVASASWRGSGVSSASRAQVSSWRVPAAVTTCTHTNGQTFETAAVTWQAATRPRSTTPLTYTATINGVAAQIQSSGTTRTVPINRAVLEQLLGSLVGGTLTVRVTPALPGTRWTGPVTTNTIRSGVTLVPLSLTLDCIS